MTAPRITAENVMELRDRVMIGSPSNAWRVSECLAVLDTIDSLHSELDTVTAERDLFRKECVALVNDCIVAPDRLSAQGGEVPGRATGRTKILEEFPTAVDAFLAEASPWIGQNAPNEIPELSEIASRRLQYMLDSLACVSPAPPHPDTVEVLQRFVDWCERYPSSRIYSYGEIAGIARIMDEIHADAKRALRAQPSATPPRDVVEVSREEWTRMGAALKKCRNKIAYMLEFGKWYDPQNAIDEADAVLRAQAQPATEREGT